jgi:hypothetical protein
VITCGDRRPRRRVGSGAHAGFQGREGLAFFFLITAVLVPAHYWQRMSQTQRYLAVVVLGAALMLSN